MSPRKYMDIHQQVRFGAQVTDHNGRCLDDLGLWRTYDVGKQLFYL